MRPNTFRRSGRDGVVELDGAKLPFPDERGAELVPQLRRHCAVAREFGMAKRYRVTVHVRLVSALIIFLLRLAVPIGPMPSSFN
jgi:hypothetical protein